MIKLTFDEAILESRDFSLIEKLLSAKECQGMSVNKLAKMFGISERRIYQLRAATETISAETISAETISAETISDEAISEDTRSESENFSDEVLRLFEENGVGPDKFKGIDADKLFSRIRAYDLSLEFDLSHKIKISSEELYNILNNN